MVTASGNRGKNPQSKVTQFKKGAPSPNPGGRPRGSKGRSGMIRKALDRVVSGEIGGEVKKLRLSEALLVKLSQSALKGDNKAIQMLLALWKESEDSMENEREAVYPFDEKDRQVIDGVYARMKACEEEDDWLA